MTLVSIGKKEKVALLYKPQGSICGEKSSGLYTRDSYTLVVYLNFKQKVTNKVTFS